MQMYLLEGISRWNQNRREAAGDGNKVRCYNTHLQTLVHKLSTEVLEDPLFDTFQKEFHDTGRRIESNKHYSSYIT